MTLATAPKPTTILLFLAAPLLFASNMVVARGLAGAMPPASLGLARWTIAALVLLPIVWPSLRAGVLRGITWRSGNMLVVGLMVLLGGVLAVAPLYAAAGHTTAGNIALIVTMTPLIVALIERVVWKVPMSPRLGLGVALAVLGIGIATSGGDWSKLAGLRLNPGDALALIAALAWAGYTVTLRHAKVSIPPVVQLWLTGVGAVLCLLPLAAAETAMGGLPELTARTLAGVTFLGSVVGVGGYSLYGVVVRRVGAANASMSMYLVPVYALVLGALLLGEPMGLHQVAALALILGGVAFGTASRRAPATSIVGALPGAAAKAG
jgi:drug/metabolite transporter (DMT)-like permease